MKKIIFITLCINFFSTCVAQEKLVKRIYQNLSGNFESNIKWYNDDNQLESYIDDNIRTNSYLKLNYNFGENFSTEIQLESYEPKPIINYYPEYKKTNISTYNLSYKNDKLNLTAGYFYEQFGSGLLLRSFEERQLGLNNAIRGGRVKYTPTNYLKLIALGGKNKIAFDVANSLVWGLDTDIKLSEAFNMSKINNLSIGLSYVGKNENFDTEDKKINIPSNFPKQVHSFSLRTNLDLGNFYTNIEYTLKGKDMAYSFYKGIDKEIYNNYFTGNALLYTLGYTQKGLGFSGTFRRLENMAFYAKREFAKPSNNQYHMLSINYIPTLTKQQDYGLANIYMYQSQPNLIISDFDGRAGEIGGQIDLYYNIKKGTKLGGKYGTKLAFNYSHWSLLKANFNTKNNTYSSDFFSSGSTLNRDFNIEMKKKWSKNLSSIFTYIHKIIDRGVALGGPLGVQGDIKNNIAIAEATYKLKNRKSIRLELQHLWTKEDKKNWIGSTAEFVFNSNLSAYATDNYNYGNDKEKIHYYNIGGRYTKGSTQIALNYGRQRGGFICVGGVCRYEQPNKGLTLNINKSF